MSLNSTEVRFSPRKHNVSASWVKNVVDAALRAEKKKNKSVSIYLTNDKEIAKYHKVYLNDPTPTDVISFGSEAVTRDENGFKFLGDLVVSTQMAKSVSKELKIPYRQEVARYLVHGVLHLLGYDDIRPKDYKEMHKTQEAILKKIRL